MPNDVDFDELKGIRRWWAEVRRGWEDALLTNGLLRHLVHEPSFLGAVIALAICGLGVVVIVPKVWNPAPPGFSKKVRVSLLDYLQAWNLRRTAKNAMAEGRWNEALLAWRTAIVNNVADDRLHRGLLEMLRDVPFVHSANLGVSIFSGEMLIELSGTNRVDCALVAEVLVRHRLPDLALEILRPWQDAPDPVETALRMRAQLLAGDVDGFEKAWASASSAWGADPRMQLYRSALDATGPPATAVAGLERLRAGLAGTSPMRWEAARLLCWAALRRDDASAYEEGLAVLRELDSATVADEAGAWALMARHDGAEEARKVARAYPEVPPPTPIEAIQLARAWSELGLGDLAVAMFRDHAERYGLVFEVWATYVDLLMDRREWDEVRRVAASLRAQAAGRDDLVAMTWYCDAVADLAVNRRTSAQGALGRLLGADLESPTVALRIAAGLARFGEQDTAKTLLERFEGTMADRPEYWLQVLMVAQGRRDVETMERATDRMLALRPGDVVASNVRLGLMLLRRKDPAEALTLSVRLLSVGPKSNASMINHAAALLQNARTAEAGAVLARLEPSRMSPAEKAAWELARAEYLGQSERYAEALDLGERIDAGQLMPPDAEWLDRFLVQCRRKEKESKP